jgi:hypothetical protein
MAAYYNEIDPFCVRKLRKLMRRGIIADGYVDSRSIEHVQPADLAGFRQCHFFAGVGTWSYALRMGEQYGVWVETADGKYRAYVYVNSVAANKMTISVKRYKM